MGIFITKYYLMKFILEQHQLNDRDITLVYIGKQLCDITKIYGTKWQYIFYINKLIYFILSYLISSLEQYYY
jgi:hypothetical protein